MKETTCSVEVMRDTRVVSLQGRASCQRHRTVLQVGTLVSYTDREASCGVSQEDFTGQLLRNGAPPGQSVLRTGRLASMSQHGSNMISCGYLGLRVFHVLILSSGGRNAEDSSVVFFYFAACMQPTSCAGYDFITA